MTNIEKTQEGRPAERKLLRCVIVDDERRARRALKRLLAKYVPSIEVVAEAESVNSAVAAIEASTPDVVFLDIEIIGGTGFDVLDRIDPGHFITVFITAHNNYRKESGRYPNARFLVKPINIVELQDSLLNPCSSNETLFSRETNGN